MLILRIKRAETALADGRLDEAFELVKDEDIRAHRHGQGVVERLINALVTRGKAHLDAGRIPQAATDCDKAGRLGGNLPGIEALRDAIGQTARRRHHEQQQRAETIDTARQHIAEGRLSVGRDALANLAGDQPSDLVRHANDRRVRAATAVERAQAAADRQDWPAAIAALLDARDAHAGSHDVDVLTAAVLSETLAQARSCVCQGRLDLARTLLDRLAPLAGDHVEADDLRRLLDQCVQARQDIDAGRYGAAYQGLRRLGSVLHDATWLTEATTQARQLVQNLDDILSGPLGLLGQCGQPEPTPTTAELTEIRTPPATPAAEAPGIMPDRFMMYVDGVGSYLVVRPANVSVGPGSSSRRVDVGLLAEAGLATFDIERADGDYFLASQQAVTVNDRPATRKLLAHEDKIVLSPRCRLKFLMPSAASTTGILELSSARLPKGDARRVILMDRDLVIGPGNGAHIRADHLSGPAVLHWRNGRLVCRAQDIVAVDGQPPDPAVGLGLDTRVQIGNLSMMITGV